MMSEWICLDVLYRLRRFSPKERRRFSRKREQTTKQIIPRRHDVRRGRQNIILFHSFVHSATAAIIESLKANMMKRKQ
jgi:cation transport regulator ChaC